MTALTLPVARDLDELRRLRPGRGSIGFVPTMGALHDGHLSLVRRALAENDHCIVSIFVNPTQFDDPNDLANYPKTFDDDCALLSSVGAPIVLSPHADLLYADGYRVRVSEHADALVLEGEHRPGHFDGMLTIVLKLLNIARADRAYFGEKDFQQLLLVRTMAKALFHPTRILGCPTIREDDGLAMSSRNRRLNPAQRDLAGAWAKLLADFDLPAAEVQRRVEALGFRVDYIAEQWGRRLGAVHTPPVDGGPEVRLIDNLALPGVGTYAR
jgi:pantoate--beta-alanine ligase